jgi:hypothetical protein
VFDGKRIFLENQIEIIDEMGFSLVLSNGGIS